MKFRLVTNSVVAVLLVVGLTLLAQRSRGDSDQGKARRVQVINTARLINTAEAKYRTDNGRYATWEDLYASPEFTDAKATMDKHGMPLTPGLNSEMSGGITLKLLVQGNSQYEFRLTDETDQSCHFSAFSDEKGLIFEGNVIGCAHP